MHVFLKGFLTITTVSLIGVIHCNHDTFQEWNSFLLQLILAIYGEKGVGCLLLSIVETNVPTNSNYSQKVRLSFLFG